MTAIFRTKYVSVVECDGNDCDNFYEDEDALFNNPSDADDHGKNHEWATRAGMDHFCNSCWCDECDEPVESCAHATTN